MAPDCSAPSSSLPPLPLPPYSPDTLISYVSTFTLPDPDDGSTGPTSSSTVVDRCKVRAWNYGSIRFSRDDGMLDDLESRLRWLRVGAPSPAPRLGLAPSRSPWIESEPDVRAHLEAMGQKVNSIISDSRELLQPHLKWSNGHPQWRDQLHASARPDFRLTTRTFSPPGFVNRPRLIEAKKLVHLRSIVKLMANKAGQGDGFRLIVRENGKTDLEERSWGDVGPDDKERVRKVLTQVVNEMIINDASSNLITDSARYLLIRRSIDDDDSPGEYQAHFRVSLPLGNQGLLKLDTSENDLRPLLGSSPSRLTHKPFALWLALSFDDPDQMDGEASPPKQRERPPPTKRLRTSGSRRPSQATSNMGTRSRSGGSGRGGRGGSETSGAGDRSRTLTLNGAAELQRSSHLDATISSEADSMDDEVLAYPISELQPHKVGPKTFVLSFLTSAPINASHTLPIPLFDGIVHGPYLPSTIPKQMLVPQLLNLRWLYRPSSPEPTPHDDDDDEKETVLESTPSKTEKMLPGDSSSSPATIGFPTSGSTLKLITQLSSGRLWDTFSALLTLPLPSSSSSACDNNNQDKVKRGVIVKTTCPVTFPSDPTVELYTESQARRAILTEDRVYRALSEGQHPEVMNQIVPVYHGLWGGVVPMSNRWGVQAGREIWAMVLEDCGQAVELDGLKRDDKMHILSLYTSLHASGVVHNDVEYRHWLRPPGGESSRIRLIDFDCAVVRDRRDEEYGSEWEQLVEGEMARVKSLLGTV